MPRATHRRTVLAGAREQVIRFDNSRCAGAFIVLVLLAYADVAPVDATEAFSPALKGRAQPEFTLYLPAGWKMAKSEDDSPGGKQFLFESPDKTGAYIFCRAETCDATTRDKKLADAYAADHRPFLSGGEPETDYFDERGFLLWRRMNPNAKGEFTVVSATFFGESVYHFKFFTPRREFKEFKKVLLRIADHIVFEGERPEIDGERPAMRGPLTEAQQEDLFEFSEDSVGFRIFWMVLVGLILVGLYFVERTIRLRRHREDMAELDKQIAERRAAAGRTQNRAILKDAKKYLNEADAAKGNRR
jgi:hypothetical protein